MRWLRGRPRPAGRRAMAIAAALSLLLPGLGHAYALMLPRALVWLAGVIVVSLVLRGAEQDTALVFSMSAAFAVLSALDVVLAMWLQSRSPGRH